jgi:GTP-binding protein
LKVETAEYARPAHQSQDFLNDGRPEVAFVGRSNVGKSSLLNRLLARKALARTSSTPGRTRAVHYFLVNRRFYFVDLPGYGYAKAGKVDRQGWADLVSSYFEIRGPQVGVVLLVDSKVGATPLDLAAWDFLQDHGVSVVVAATKVDKLPRGKRSAAIAAIAGALDSAGVVPVVGVSSETGDGIKDLWGAIKPHLEK